MNKTEKPSLEELEDILNAGEDSPVEILPNGEVVTAPTRIEVLKAENAMLRKSLYEHHWALLRFAEHADDCNLRGKHGAPLYCSCGLGGVLDRYTKYFSPGERG